MPRPASPREASVHVQALARMVAQIEADRRLTADRRARIKRALGAAIAELQPLIGETRRS